MHPPQNGAHPGAHFARREGLRDVVIGAYFKAQQLIHLFATGGEKQDRERRIAAQQLTAQLKAADVGQAHVQNGQVRHPVAGGIERGQPTLKNAHHKAFLLEHVDKRVGNTLLILHQPDLRLLHRRSLLFIPRHDRHGADRILRRSVNDLIGIAHVDQGVALAIVKTDDLQLFKHQRSAFLEHNVSLRLAVFNLIGHFNRPNLLAGDRRVRGVFSQPQTALNAAGFRPADIAGHVLHVRIVKGFNDDLMVRAEKFEDGIYRANLFRLSRLAAGQ